MFDTLLWAAMRCVGIDVSRQAVHIRGYAVDPIPAHPVDAEQAKFLFDACETANSHTDDKVKQLITVSSSLATFISVFAHDVRPRALVVIVVALLVVTVMLCLSVFGVRREMVPTLEDCSVNGNAQVWAADLLRSCHANRARHFFRVDLYRAASRYFLVALFGTLGLTLLQRPTADRLAQLSDTVQRIEHQGLRVRPDSSVRRVDTVFVQAPATSTTGGTPQRRSQAPKHGSSASSSRARHPAGH